MRRTSGFTLVEILIVVVLLAVLAAVVIPSIGNSATAARETTLAMDVSLLRRFIQVYAGQHLEVAPGYPDGNRSLSPMEDAFVRQATASSNSQGQTAARGTAGFPWGPYVSNIPPNPFNKRVTIRMLADGDAFPPAPDDQHGWIYKAATGEIRPGNAGTDDNGTAYYNY